MSNHALQVTSDQIAVLYHYGKFLYNLGDYNSAADMLFHYRVLVRKRRSIAIFDLFAANLCLVC